MIYHSEYIKLAKAMENAPTIPPCMNTDPELFFPDQDANVNLYKTAKELCATCPIIKQCLEYALKTNEEFGVWGGLTAFERRKLKRGGKITVGVTTKTGHTYDWRRGSRHSTLIYKVVEK